MLRDSGHVHLDVQNIRLSPGELNLVQVTPVDSRFRNVRSEKVIDIDICSTLMALAEKTASLSHVSLPLMVKRW